MIRRPDVVIVNDPTRPPTQDNIKQVVEMKFPPDPPNEDQTSEYSVIAGDANKVIEMSPSDCDCSQEPQEPNVPVEQLGWAATVASGLMYFLTRGRSPRAPMPAPAH